MSNKNNWIPWDEREDLECIYLIPSFHNWNGECPDYCLIANQVMKDNKPRTNFVALCFCLGRVPKEYIERIKNKVWEAFGISPGIFPYFNDTAEYKKEYCSNIEVYTQSEIREFEEFQAIQYIDYCKRNGADKKFRIVLDTLNYFQNLDKELFLHRKNYTSAVNDNDEKNKIQDYCLQLELSDNGNNPVVAIKHIGKIKKSQVELFRKRCLTELKGDLQTEMIRWYNGNWSPSSPRLYLSMIPFDELTDEQEASLDSYFLDKTKAALESLRKECCNSDQVETVVDNQTSDVQLDPDLESSIFPENSISAPFVASRKEMVDSSVTEVKPVDSEEVKLLKSIDKTLKGMSKGQKQEIENQQQTADTIASISIKKQEKINSLDKIPELDTNSSEWCQVTTYAPKCNKTTDYFKSERYNVKKENHRTKGAVAEDGSKGFHGKHVWRCNGKDKNGNEVYWYYLPGTEGDYSNLK